MYGLQPVSLDLNLCNLAAAVCPLPLYNFSGSGTLPLPSSFSSRIPSIGYSVPDLEAIAQLELISVETGEIAACVSATLSNGWSMKQVGATWGAVGVVLLSIVGSALWAMARARWSAVGEVGMWAEKETWRVVDVIIFVQSIAVSALLNLNYRKSLLHSPYYSNIATSAFLRRILFLCLTNVAPPQPRPTEPSA